LHCPDGSSAPAGTFLQLPRASSSAHDWHAPEQAVLQQTPWAQTPLLHSLLSTHEAPTDLRPQLWRTQTDGGAHELSPEQAAAQRAPSQTYGKQARASGYTHTEAPLQVAAGV
jgi:hypothetical protein